ncbi:MAG: hypothetical protein AW08_00017 [Candidatus Accumulibacter adjunctus]|uniref:Restriction endonuclease type I HsdR N-terminal domain-containing protein n=1 Tax=Candidatus Accumulibacter adjunctus TaxID=1454001 RepID=A0A011PT31_9PROT|nr:MAG: hypothetical protein AW08_00017 [Candidatus Accumulibacter adjunctus]
MSSGDLTKSVVEEASLAWLESAGWQVRSGAEIAPGERATERDDYGQVVLAQRLRDAIARLNPSLPAEAPDDAFCKLMLREDADLLFIVFEDDGGCTAKKMVGRHQFHVMRVAASETRRAKALATTIAEVAKGNRAVVVLAWQQKVQDEGNGT